MSLTLVLVNGVLAASTGGLVAFLASQQGQLLVYGVIMVGFFYFGILRPQQRRQKEQAAKMAGMKRGDVVMLTGGLLGKVVRVEDDEVGLEIAPNVTVKVVKSQVADIRTRPEPAANDAKSRP
jgi:preprotein translocase subunit YajC